MEKRLEIEQKFYFKDIKSFYNLLSENNLTKIEDENISDSDEYFTDINSEYIKNRTCLRIRTTNTIPTIAKNLTQILLIYINNI